MSKQVDERVVSMQFDNAQFEKNVQTSMSTLDKLKQKLNLNGATKGLENVNAAAKNVNMSGISGAVETVHAKFSALEVMGVTALANITNSAVNAGKRIVSALTIDPVTTGFSEYELKMNSVRTIMASTGADIETVNKYLEELNTYSDQTIYSFSDMTQNIGKFTNAGVELEDAVLAIKGISNEAAVSGANANEASRAMYNFAQALSAGYVKLIDWKSIENANMATVEFKEELMKTAVELGTIKESANGMYETLEGNAFNATQNFNEVLQDQWMTTDVLVKTLGKYADETTDIGKKAFEAATKVTTLTQMFDVMKETAQSGWAKTWELIFGDFEEAKDFFSSVTESFSTFIDGMSDGRNNILEEVLNSKWDSFIKEINDAGIATEDFNEKLKETAKEQGISVDKLIEEHGTFANVIAKGLIPTEAYVETLEKFDAKTEEAAASLTRANEYIVVKGDNLTKIARRYGTTWKELYKLNQDIINDPNLIYPDQVLKLTDAQLENMGYTKEQINVLRDLAKEAKETGTPMNELVTAMGKPSGRQLLFDTLKNTMSAVLGVMNEIGGAWSEIFPPENLVSGLTKLIENLHAFSEGLVLNDDKADKLRRTFKGLFAILDIIGTIVGGPIKLAFKIINKILGIFGYSMLDVTANVGDALVAFRDWIDSIFDVEGAFNFIMPYLKTAGGWIKDMAIKVKDWVASCEGIKKVSEYFRNAFSGIKEWFAGLKTADNIPQYIIQGLANGIRNGASAVWSAVTYLATSLINKIKEVLGIHSPSKVMIAIGGFIIAGLVTGILDGIPGVGDALGGIRDKISEVLGGIEWGSLFSGGVTAGLVATLFNIGVGFKNLTKPLDGVGEVLEGTGEILSSTSEVIEKSAKPIKKILNNASKVVKNFSKILGGISMNLKAEAIKSIAVAIALLAASIWVLAQLDTGKLWGAVGAIAVLMGLVGGLTFIVGKFGPEEGMQFAKMAPLILSIGVAVILMSSALKKIASIDPNRFDQAIGGLLLMMGGIAAIVFIFGKTVKGSSAKSVGQLGKTILGISVALLLLTGVIKILSMMDPSAFKQGLSCVAALATLVVILMAATNLFAKDTKVGKTLFAMAAAIGILALVAVLLGSIDRGKLIQGGIAVAVLGGIIVGLMAATRLFAKDSKAGATLLAMAAAIGILALVALMLGSVKTESLIKGGVAVLALAGIIVGLMAATKLFAKDTKVGMTLLAISGAIAILGLTASLLGFVPVENLKRGIIAVGVLAVIVAGLMAATRLLGGKGSKMASTLLAMAGAVAILAGVAIVLGFIPVDNLKKGVIAVGVLTLLMSLMMKASKNSARAFKSILAMAGVIAVMAIAVGVLSFIEADKLAASAMSIGGLMLVMAGVMISISKCGKISKGAIVSLAIMGLVVAELGIILGLITLFPLENSIEAAISLSILLISMSAACLIVKNIPLKGAAEGALGLVVFVGIIAALLAALGGLSKIPGFNELIKDGGETLALIGYAIGNFVGSIIGGLAAGLTSGLPTIGTNLSLFMINATPFIMGVKMVDASVLEGAGILAGTIIALTVADVIHAIGQFVGGDFIGLGRDLSAFMAAATPFIIGLKMVTPAMSAAAGNLASLIMAITVADVIDGIKSMLGLEGGIDTFGEKLAGFGESMKDFLASIKDLTDADLTRVDIAAQAGSKMADMANKVPKEGGWAQDILGSTDMKKFSEGIVAYGEALVAFSGSVGTLKDADFDRVKIATDAGIALAGLQNDIPKDGGWAQDILGASSFETFGKGIVEYGGALVNYAKTISKITQDDADKISMSADAGKALSDLNGKIPKQKGWAQDIMGSQDMKIFGDGIVAFAKGLMDYIAVAKTIDDTAVGAITNSGSAVDALKKVAEKVPKSGGWGAAIVGSKDSGGFGEAIRALGVGIKVYIASVKNINDDSITQIKNSGNAITALKDVVKLVPTDTTNTQNVSSFITTMTSVVDGILDYIDSSHGVSDEGIEAINKSKTASEAIVEVVNSIGEIDSTEVTSAIKNIQSMVGVISEMTITNFTGADKFKAALDTLASTDIAGFGETMKSLGETGLNEFVSAFTESSAKAAEAGETLISAITNGVTSGKETLGNAVQDVVAYIMNKTPMFSMVGRLLMMAFKLGISSQVSSVKEVMASVIDSCSSVSITDYLKFYNAGSYLVDGFVAGISANSYKAEAQAAAMADAAYEAAKEELDVNSPSKVFRRLGMSVPEGFAMGIDKLGGMAERSSVSMARAAISGTQDAISRIVDVINSDMDTQPTIRPVLDLSEISSGAGAINGMLGIKPSIGVISNINSIGSMMNSRQNGTNSDVVSAIRELGKTIGSGSGDTYTINGITYDDGSNITDAVKTLVRAARVERRR